jgi:hypothetical protein
MDTTTKKYSIPGVGLVADPTKYGYPADYTGEASLTDRYAPAQGAVSDPKGLSYSLKDNAGKIVTYQGTPTVNPLRETYRAEAQGTVDAIRSSFESAITARTEQKKKLETKAYLSSLAGGRAASGMGAAETTVASETGQKKVDEAIQEREAKVNQALSNADIRAGSDWTKRQTEYIGAAADQTKATTELASKVKTEAESEISAYAGAMSYDEWSKKVGTPKIQQYMKETGRDETGLQALFLKNAKNDLVDANGTKLSDGSVVFMKKVFDNKGNLVGTKEVGRVAGSGGKKIKESRITDNGVQILYEDGTYEERGNEPGTSVASGKPIAGAPTGFIDSDIALGRETLRKFGKGGYANPGLYLQAYQKWIESRGTTAKFKELYPPDEFIDPKEADLVPTYLQPSKAARKGGTTVPAVPTGNERVG